MSSVLITGASGFIGRHLASALAKRGYHLRVLARESSDLSGLAALSYERFNGDLTDPLSLIPAVRDVDYVYHVGGLIQARSEEEFIAVNGEGTKNLCAAAKTHAPNLKRFLYLSSAAAAGPGNSSTPLDESIPARPLTPYGASKRLGEQWLGQFDFLWAIVRPPAVYGPGDKGVFKFFQVIARHIRPTLGKDGIASVVYVDNLVDGMILAAERPEGVGQIFLIADDQPYRRSELSRLIQTALATWAVPVTFPAWLVRFCARCTEAVAAGFKTTALFDSHKANELLAFNWACNIDKAKLLLGYQPKVATPEGLRRAAEWYRQSGWIK